MTKIYINYGNHISILMVLKKVLIVEDEGLVALALEEILKRIGYEVPGIAETGEEAIAMAGRHNPDVILMDINLKGEMDGIVAAEKIHSAYDVPIIFLTAYTDDDIITRAINAGTSGYLVKPVNVKEMFANIELAINNRKRDRTRVFQPASDPEGIPCKNPECGAMMVRAYAPIGPEGRVMSSIGWICPQCKHTILGDK